MRLSIIGTGNVATHLARLFFGAGHTIECILGRNRERTRRLAKSVKARAVTKPADVMTSDCIILAVNDDALAPLASKLPLTNSLVVHTSGSEPLDVLRRFPNSGVLYPLQTFTAGAPAPASVPICVEASNAGSLRKTKKLASSISGSVMTVDSRKRLVLHAAAVFSNNFTNHLYVIASELLRKEGVPWKFLHPLVEETTRKALRQMPGNVQTGPARRGDRKTQAAHLRLLKRNKKTAALYKLLSASIAGTP